MNWFSSFAQRRHRGARRPDSAPGRRAGTAVARGPAEPAGYGRCDVVIAVSFGVVGLVVAWHRPRNPLEWLMIVLARGFSSSSAAYNVFNSWPPSSLAPVVLLPATPIGPDFMLVPLTVPVPGQTTASPRWRRWWRPDAHVADVILQAQMVRSGWDRRLNRTETTGTAWSRRSRSDWKTRGPGTFRAVSAGVGRPWNPATSQCG